MSDVLTATDNAMAFFWALARSYESEEQYHHIGANIAAHLRVVERRLIEERETSAAALARCVDKLTVVDSILGNEIADEPENWRALKVAHLMIQEVLASPEVAVLAAKGEAQ